MTTSDKTWESVKAGYLRQVEKSLAAAGYPSSKGIIEEVGAHLDQRYADLPPESRNWDGYQAAITEMGPPSDYVELLGIAKLKRRIITWRRVAIGLPFMLVLVFVLLVVGVYRGVIPLGLYNGPRIYPLPGERFEWTFTADPRLVGQWESVDFVDSPSQFTPENKWWRGTLWLKCLDFHDGGKIFAAAGSNEVPNPRLQEWMQWAWTKDWIVDRAYSIRAQYEIQQIDDETYLVYPWLSGDVSLRNMRPKYYVLKKLPAVDDSASNGRREDAGENGRFDTVTKIQAVDQFDDVRWKDLSDLDLSARNGIVATLQFNAKTVWPKKLPPGEDPQSILAAAMNPGLGVRKLHDEGITGQGVNVAIIDQPLCPDHPEYDGKIVKYFDAGCGSEDSMHGPAVASLLVGTNCGTAPGARLYYAAAPSWLADSAYYAKAMDWILEQNASLPPGQRIRAVSVSVAPSGRGSPFNKNQDKWDDACRRAREAGVLVLDCTADNGFIGPCRYDPAAPEDAARCQAGFPGMPSRGSGHHVLAPCSLRTTSEHFVRKEPSYAYWGRGGLSWSIPYATGVLALGWQLAPELTGDEMKQLLFDSAYADASGAKFINPPKFIDLVKQRHQVATP